MKGGDRGEEAEAERSKEMGGKRRGGDEESGEESKERSETRNRIPYKVSQEPNRVKRDQYREIIKMFKRERNRGKNEVLIPNGENAGQ